MRVSHRCALLLLAVALIVAALLPIPSPALAPALEKPGLTGKVTFDGDKPDLDKLTKLLQERMHAKDEDHCLAKEATAEEKSQQAWKFDDKGGVANVFVWIAPPKGKFFHIDPAKKTWKDELVIDQPHCAFTPHAVVVFPYYKDDTGKKVETKQKFLIKNSSKELVHHTSVTVGPGPNQTIPAGGAPVNVELEAADEPVFIKCDIHNWMSAYVLVLDHPYAAITGKDGTFKIENAPVGEEVRIFAWHEVAGFLNEGGAKGETIKLEAATVKNFKCKAK
jgi:hypothetical protein